MDRSALITGGTGGLGSAVTGRFLDDGWRVVVPWVVERELERVERRDGLELAQADLSDPAAVDAVVERAAGERDAPLRAVVNLVGGYFAGPRVHETELEDFERQVALNLRPTFLVTRAALPHLVAAGGGAVVCMGTRAAVSPFKGAAAYAASKAAVIAFAQAVAVDYRDDGVRANALLPSVHRHAGQPRPDAERRPLQVGGARDHRRHDRLPVLRRGSGDERGGDPGLRPRVGERAPGRGPAGPLEALATVAGMERKWWTLIAVCTATFMLLLDITVVNVALPDIQRSLDATLQRAAVGGRRLRADARRRCC